jgi:3-dehydroquinate synthase
MINEITEYKKSRIIIGELLENFPNYIPDKYNDTIIIITDTNIKKYHGEKFPLVPIIEIGTGEKIKTQKTVDTIISKLIELGADRHSYLVGIGGGIVCDITGYVASVFMRGIRFGFVSTSLLSQVDASIGGKNGINHTGFKNMVGTFNHPDFVICDTELLATLPPDEIRNGMAEVVKHAIISDAAMLFFVKKEYENILKLSHEHISYLIQNSIRIKSSFVIADEKEVGERKKLNLGHTFGHAIEKLCNISHGSAVSVGIVEEAELSFKFGYCTRETVTKITELLRSLGLPTEISFDKDQLFNAIKKDKKQNRDKLDFIFIEDIGRVTIKQVKYAELLKHI